MAIAAVRPATASDVPEIVRIQTLTWSTAYSDLVPRSAIEQIGSPEAHAAWERATETGTVLIATEGGAVVGFVAAGPAEAPENATPPNAPTLGPEAWGEIGVLLVEPRWGRRGHGGRLLAYAAAALREAGAVYGLAWVPEADAASRRFYARAGWELDGAVRVLDTGKGTMREVRFVGSLDLELVE
ncbi:Protein N-acetyltransferase, RimJ/RimL family [Pseudonocardia thermophila]|jgi:Acetyltransferases, including N-acetylases of ribosomal proteins|uniref:Protein N-acetyltransferase, RimJ/RimL family n=1 Tax=Pseudonocardia thermophila TaxID=1848 RepID=A0A1M6ZA49_PSETH|nr:GNAT family N-acetyltransferase [Pseudonocardia thermophila]SHL27338.1 Protein N-acetyltransferase, RimJ/RimL family [Pseudonocardia thermophila]